VDGGQHRYSVRRTFDGRVGVSRTDIWRRKWHSVQLKGMMNDTKRLR
jgi:hypothetical protein